MWCVAVQFCSQPSSRFVCLQNIASYGNPTHTWYNKLDAVSGSQQCKAADDARAYLHGSCVMMGGDRAMRKDGSPSLCKV